MPKTKAKTTSTARTIDLTDRERALLAKTIGTVDLPPTDLEHLIARDDLLRLIDPGDQLVRMPGGDAAKLGHFGLSSYRLSPEMLNVVRQALATPGQSPGAWRVSAGIARKLPKVTG